MMTVSSVISDSWAFVSGRVLFSGFSREDPSTAIVSSEDGVVSSSDIERKIKIKAVCRPYTCRGHSFIDRTCGIGIPDRGIYLCYSILPFFSTFFLYKGIFFLYNSNIFFLIRYLGNTSYEIELTCLMILIDALEFETSLFLFFEFF